MSLAISKFKSIFKNQICHKSCKIHAYKFAFHGEYSVSLDLLASKYLSTNIQIIVSAKSLFSLLLLTFWLYSLGSPQELPRKK